MRRAKAAALVLVCAVFTACNSPSTTTPQTPAASASPTSGSASPGATTSPATTGQASATPAPAGGTASPAAAAPPAPPATFRPGIAVYFDGEEKIYKADAVGTYTVGADGQNKYELKAALPDIGYQDAILTLIADKTPLAPGFAASQVDRVSLLIQHAQTPQQFVGPPATALTLVSSTGRLTGVAEGQVKPLAGAPKVSPLVRVEFDVPMPAASPTP